jgi:hypothetical protein
MGGDGAHPRGRRGCLVASGSVDARTLTRAHALGRVALGAGLTLAPRLTAAAWLGRDARRPATQVPIRALGARDLAIGLGTAYAVGQGHGVRPWLGAGALADAIDLAATVRVRHRLPAAGVATVALMAGGSVLLELWLGSQLD